MATQGRAIGYHSSWGYCIIAVNRSQAGQHPAYRSLRPGIAGVQGQCTKACIVMMTSLLPTPPHQENIPTRSPPSFHLTGGVCRHYLLHFNPTPQQLVTSPGRQTSPRPPRPVPDDTEKARFLITPMVSPHAYDLHPGRGGSAQESAVYNLEYFLPKYIFHPITRAGQRHLCCNVNA